MSQGLTHVGRMAEVMVFLGFERNWWRGADGRTKGEVIEAALEITEAQYNERLSQIAEYDEAMSYDRMTVIRLRQMKARGRLA